MIYNQTSNKKKIYTVPEGTYNGSWSGKFCWLFDKDGAFYRFETKHITKKTCNVTIIITGVKAIVNIKSVRNFTKTKTQ